MTEHPGVTGTEPRTEAELLAEAIHHAMCDWSAHDGFAPDNPHFTKWRNVGRSVAAYPPLAAALARSGDLSKLNAALEKAWAERPGLRPSAWDELESSAPPPEPVYADEDVDPNDPRSGDPAVLVLRTALEDIRDGQAADEDIRFFGLDAMTDQRGTNWSMWAISRATEALEALDSGAPLVHAEEERE